MRCLLLSVTFILLPHLALAQSVIELHAGPEIAVHPDSYSSTYPVAVEIGARYNVSLSERLRLTVRSGYGYANAREEDNAHLDIWVFGGGLRLHPDEIGIDDYMGIEIGVRSLRADGVLLDGETVRTERERYLAGRAYLGFVFPARRSYIAVEPAATAFLVDGDPHVLASLQVVLPIW